MTARSNRVNFQRVG